jgi:hypothetical protein
LWDDDRGYAQFLRDQKRTQTPRDWPALFQQAPAPHTADYFKSEWLRPYQTIPAISRGVHSPKIEIHVNHRREVCNAPGWRRDISRDRQELRRRNQHDLAIVKAKNSPGVRVTRRGYWGSSVLRGNLGERLQKIFTPPSLQMHANCPLYPQQNP